MAKDVLRLKHILTIRRPLLTQVPEACSVASQYRPQCSYRFQRSFSLSNSALRPRTRPCRDGYPGFRNESKERRYVREHNLFDPQSQYPDSAGDVSNSTNYVRALKYTQSTLSRRHASSSDLERELLFLSSRFPTDPRARNLLHHILYERQQPPDAVQYEALILANASPEHGSAENVRKLAAEIEQLGIPTNINIYNAILRSLVIHPDIDILSSVIEACGRLWIEIDTEMRHLICAVYLRAGMPEIALDHLGHIEHGSGESTLGTTKSGLQRGKAELWLYVMFIRQLAENHDWEGVMRLCYRLCDDTSLGIPLASRHLDVPYSFWGWLLEQASAAKEKWVTFWVWENWVIKARVRPHSGTCLRVLEICADNGAIRVAETVPAILRFLTKEIDDPRPNLESGSQMSSDQHQDTVKTLLTRTHENAHFNESRPSEAEIRRITAEWWMFDVEDKVGLNSNGEKGQRSLRIDPWSTLRESSDPGHAWARRLNEREEARQRHNEREALRQAHVRRAKIEAGYETMRKTLPSQMLVDIEKAATAELEAGGTDVVSEPTSQDTSSMTDTEDELLSPRIRLIDPKRRKHKAEVENARIAQWQDLGLDLDTALKMDEQKGNRAWTLKDSGNYKDSTTEPADDAPTPTNARMRFTTENPRVRLVKLAETSPNAEWYSEWSEMLAARRRFEKALQRKRDALAAKERESNLSQNGDDDASGASVAEGYESKGFKETSWKKLRIESENKAGDQKEKVDTSYDPFEG